MDVIGRFCKIYTDICQISPDDLEHIYADDILFIDPITTHHGIDEVKRYFSNLLTQAESCKFDIADIFTCSPNGSKEHPSSHSKVTHIANWTMTLTLKDSDKQIEEKKSDDAKSDDTDTEMEFVGLEGRRSTKFRMLNDD